MSDPSDRSGADTTDTLRESENQYRRMVEMSPDMVLLCDEAGIILYVNLVGVEMLGFDSQREVLGRNLLDFVHPNSQPGVRARLAEHMTPDHALPFLEVAFLRADRAPFDAEMMAFPFVRQGAPVAHLVVRDISRRKEAEATQRRLKRRLFLAAGLAALILAGSGGYYGYQYTESTGFCGNFCHSVMGPRSAQHANSPHAHVSCADCHIGHGAAWYVKAKISGLHQVYATLARKYPNPIPAPIVNLRPANETCEACHSPKVFHGTTTAISRRVPPNGDPRDPEVTALSLHVGGMIAQTREFVGIHWHADPENKVEYQALDPKRLSIPRVRVSRGNGPVTLYASTALPAPPAEAPWRVMDCSDCHNRVAHHRQSPEQAVDGLILSGRLDFPLPDIKKAALQAIQARYETLKSARPGILNSLKGYYQLAHPKIGAGDPATWNAMADVLYHEAYAPNVDPDLKIAWDTYPDHLSHNGGAGCFRCHDGQHLSTDGSSIGSDCDRCHRILLDGVRASKIDPAIRAVFFTKDKQAAAPGMTP